MPRYGTLDVNAWAESAPRLQSFKPEPWALKGARFLECRFEIDDDPALTIVPSALHPSVPAAAAVNFVRAADSPAGPYNMALVRVAVRVGGRPCFFLVNSFCDSEPVRKLLSERWGYRIEPAEVSLKDLHYNATGTVRRDGKTILEITLTHRAPLPGTRLNWPPTLMLVRGPEDGKLVLTGITSESSYAQTEGGRLRIETLDSEAIGTGNALRYTAPMSITVGTADLTVAAIEFTVDPTVPSEQGMSFVEA